MHHIIHLIFFLFSKNIRRHKCSYGITDIRVLNGFLFYTHPCLRDDSKVYLWCYTLLVT